MPPLKRHPALVAYSHDHHFGLLLGWKIKQGAAKNIAVERICNYVTAFANTELLPHFIQEEKELLFILDEKDNYRLQAEEEHTILRNKIAELQPSSATYEDLKLFAKLLEAHIRFEERVLFNMIQEHPLFEQHIASNVKEVVKEDFDNSWEDHFWK